MIVITIIMFDPIGSRLSRHLGDKCEGRAVETLPLLAIAFILNITSSAQLLKHSCNGCDFAFYDLFCINLLAVI